MPKWNTFDAFLADAAKAPSNQARQQLVDALLAERPAWPWVQGNIATFIYSSFGTKSVALNMDILKGDPPFAPLTNLPGTTLWYVSLSFAHDDLLDYMLAIDDPMTPLAQEKDLIGRVSRHWRTDPRNPLGIHTAQIHVSVLHMDGARPFPDWSAMRRVPRGRVSEHLIDSQALGYTSRKLWVYTPPGYENSEAEYPLLIMLDGQWAVGPLQMPYIADALIKHKRIKPLIIAMKQSGDQEERNKIYVSNDNHYAHMANEVLPFLQARYRVDSQTVGIGGIAVSAVAAAYSALKNPAAFSSLLMISPPLGKGPEQTKLSEYAERFAHAAQLPQHIFQSVGRYEGRARFYKPALALRDVISRRNVYYKFVEAGSGHGLVGFRSVLPEALAWAFAGEAFVG